MQLLINYSSYPKKIHDKIDEMFLWTICIFWIDQLEHLLIQITEGKKEIFNQNIMVFICSLDA